MYKQKSRAFKNPLWVSVGGHFEDKDNGNPTNCIKRELYEETGLTFDDFVSVYLKYVTLRKAHDELRQQYVYFAELKNTVIIKKECDEGILGWVKISDLSQKDMSVTNTSLLDHYYSDSKIRKDNKVYGGVASMINKAPKVEFTSLDIFDTKY